MKGASAIPSNVNERLLAEKLGLIDASFPGHGDLIRVLNSLVTTAADPGLVRI